MIRVWLAGLFVVATLAACDTGNRATATGASAGFSGTERLVAIGYAQRGSEKVSFFKVEDSSPNGLMMAGRALCKNDGRPFANVRIEDLNPNQTQGPRLVLTECA